MPTVGLLAGLADPSCGMFTEELCGFSSLLTPQILGRREMGINVPQLPRHLD
jgi:hypothetical protein